MTPNDPRMLDLTAFDRPSDRRSGIDPRDLHLLRLALDLHLDAMLLTLGAAAHAQAQGDDADDGVPWQRWLAEDLDVARALATTLFEGEAAPVPGLGGRFANAGVHTSLENLAARYESMEKLLTDVLDRPSNGQHWRGPATEALQRCRRRRLELHHHRRVVIAAASPPVTFLPGELLG
jgi:hypothetical protein